jgi:molybdopterin converting factor small subunit
MSTDTIKKRLKIISDLQEEVSRIKSVYEESLEDNPVYQEVQKVEERYKEETKDKKQKIRLTPNIMAIDNELKDLRKQIKENREILAAELAEYYKESGSLEITDTDGTTKRIVFSVRLVSK